MKWSGWKSVVRITLAVLVVIVLFIGYMVMGVRDYYHEEFPEIYGDNPTAVPVSEQEDNVESGVQNNAIHDSVSEPCKFLWNNSDLTAAERFECEKEYSNIETEYGYSRYSYFPEQITLTGTYRKYYFDEGSDEYWYLSDTLHFKPGEGELAKLPVSDYTDGQVNFRFYDEVEQLFKVPPVVDDYTGSNFCTLEGRATIQIDEITIDNFEGGVPLSYRLDADLVQILEQTPYKVECEESGQSQIEDVTVLYQNQFDSKSELEEIFRDEENKIVFYESFIPGSSACCGIVKFNEETQEFTKQTGYLPAAGDRLSPTGQYIVRGVGGEGKIMQIIDIVLDEAVIQIEFGDNETFSSGFCGYDGVWHDVSWANENTVEYGVYDMDSSEEDLCNPLLIEKKQVSIY